MDQAHIQRSAVARLLLEVFNDQIYKYGFVHSDPHPGTSGPGGRRLLVPSRLMLCGRCGTGNILVRVHKHRPQIVLLDHGLYMSLTPEFRYLSLPPPLLSNSAILATTLDRAPALGLVFRAHRTPASCCWFVCLFVPLARLGFANLFVGSVKRDTKQILRAVQQMHLDLLNDENWAFLLSIVVTQHLNRRTMNPAMRAKLEQTRKVPLCGGCL